MEIKITTYDRERMKALEASVKELLDDNCEFSFHGMERVKLAKGLTTVEIQGTVKEMIHICHMVLKKAKELEPHGI